jgi:hypothetical protein
MGRKGKGNSLKSITFSYDFNESAYKNMLKNLLRDRLLMLVILLIIIIRLLALASTAIEYHYTYGFYPIISSFLRILFGWIPFSIGDLIYLAGIIYIIIKLRKYILLIRRKAFPNPVKWHAFRKLIIILGCIYIVFHLFWGLNYYRLGIASQLNLEVKPYTTADLTTLAVLLQEKLNHYAVEVDSLHRARLNNNSILFREGMQTYSETGKQFSYLKYGHRSLKPSLFTHIGKYIGFTGYYNPFSGEAQIKTTEPVFMKPFILTHEMAHQLGYAKENEANFVGYMASKTSSNSDFNYSAYFEMTLYALSDLRRRDSATVIELKNEWEPRVKNDYLEYLRYLKKSENPVEPFIMKFYNQFLKINNQPHGNRTYNEVIAWLIAYMKKYGPEAI